MIRLGIAPRVMDFARNALSIIDTWFTQVTERFNISEVTSGPATSEVPMGQWGIYKSLATGQVTLTVNDAGTLKSTEIPGITKANSVFSAEANAVTAIASSVNTKVLLGTKMDPDNAFNLATSRFQPTVAGYYFIRGMVQLDFSIAAVAALIVGLYQNGVAKFQEEVVTSATATNFSCSTSGIFLLNGTTDFVELFCFQNSGASKNTTNAPNTSMVGFRVRAT